MPYLMRIVAGALGEPSPHNGLYLRSVEFDVDANGGCSIETTPDPELAYCFGSTSELLETWRRQSVVRPLRDDQKPNRPMTAWTIETINWSDAEYVKPVQHCDFCQTAEPTRMYAHPYIESKILATIFQPGHWGTCNRCGNLLEAGDLDGLIERVALPVEIRAIPRVVAEFKRIYSMISRTREAYETPEVYRKRYS